MGVVFKFAANLVYSKLNPIWEEAVTLASAGVNREASLRIWRTASPFLFLHKRSKALLLSYCARGISGCGRGNKSICVCVTQQTASSKYLSWTE